MANITEIITEIPSKITMKETRIITTEDITEIPIQVNMADLMGHPIAAKAKDIMGDLMKGITEVKVITEPHITIIKKDHMEIIMEALTKVIKEALPKVIMEDHTILITEGLMQDHITIFTQDIREIITREGRMGIIKEASMAANLILSSMGNIRVKVTAITIPILAILIITTGKTMDLSMSHLVSQHLMQDNSNRLSANHW